MLTFDKKSNPACYKHNEANCQALLTNEKRDAPKKRVISLSSTFFVQKHSCLVFIFTTSSSRLDTSVEATNKGI